MPSGANTDTPVDWHAARRALAAEVARVVGLLRSVEDPHAPAIGQWTLAEEALHLSQVWIAVPALAAEDLSAVYELVPERRGRHGGSLLGDVWDLGATTVAGVAADPVRDPVVIADRIETRAHRFLSQLDEATVEREHPWLVEGVRVPTAVLICHLLNETVVHGWDLARAAGRRWPVPAEHAALVISGFLMPILARLDPRAMVDQHAAAGLRATYRLRVRGGREHTLVFDDGTVAVDPLHAPPADCHLSAHPTAMLLVAWGRRSPWPAVVTGRFTAWGRRPWLGPRFPTLLRNV